MIFCIMYLVYNNSKLRVEIKRFDNKVAIINLTVNVIIIINT